MPIEVPKATLEKWRKLVERLAFNSQKGRLTWEEGAISDSVVTNIADFTLSLTRTNDENRIDYIVRVFNNTGALIDYFMDSQVDTQANRYHYFRILDELFREAQRKITGADIALDEILDNLIASPDEEIPF